MFSHKYYIDVVIIHVLINMKLTEGIDIGSL